MRRDRNSTGCEVSSPAPGRVSPLAALAFATVGFVALLIMGFGLTSLLAEAEVIAVPGLGPLPGVLGVAASAIAVAAVLWPSVRAAHPSYWAAAVAAAAALIAFLAGLWLGAVVSGADPARAVAAAGGFATSGFAVVLVGAAIVSAWAAIALVRTRAGRPHWPWENDDEE